MELGYKVKLADGSIKDIGNIAAYQDVTKNEFSNLSSSITFNPILGTAYCDSYIGMPNAKFVSSQNTILKGKWGKTALKGFKYINRLDGSQKELLFAHRDSCPTPARSISAESTSAFIEQWGDYRFNPIYDGSYILLTYVKNNEIKLRTGNGYETTLTGTNIIFIDLVAGGGGGGGAYGNTTYGYDGGGGGGGGASVFCALDISQCSPVKIVMGKRGTGGGSSTREDDTRNGTSGEDSSITLCYGLTGKETLVFQCKGGSGGNRAVDNESGSGGSGGTAISNYSDNNVYHKNGVLEYQIYNGKRGGDGGSGSGASYQTYQDKLPQYGDSFKWGSSWTTGHSYSDIISSFGIYSKNIPIGALRGVDRSVTPGQTGQAIQTITIPERYYLYDFPTTLMPKGGHGGGGGASALGYATKSDTDTFCGAGGAGGCSRMKDNSSYFDHGLDGKSGCCIIHYCFSAGV